ncbi:efflux RND transporter periplasmic adaptor subunit [Methylomicrobium sp. Wu6]|uniref:efflux RND transporter periplasmic adaptor subunit n=1 Tax=Methylomicrobium sp. Wu6 TaxID=3107928 RepID=UPI002DD622BC|nr:efflux RND transporter periplasmic adaptor subunit [Methylomicrobium sp. Wu6]
MNHSLFSFTGRSLRFKARLIVFATVILFVPVVWQAGQAQQHIDATAVVKLAGPRIVAVQAGSLLEQKLDISVVLRDQITTPLLLATGSVVAHLAPGSNPSEDRWQFNTIELSGVYADWQRARAEKEFNIKRLTKIRELTAAQTQSQGLVVERLRKLVATGTEAIRDLTAAEANLLQVQLEGQKAVYEAETALTVATRNRAALERTLLQDGVDPVLLENAASGTSLIKADVPELKISLVSAGQACVAKFYGLPGQTFNGKVKSLAPALSAEQHTLRVFFELPDVNNKFKPGMYAEIGLGTDPRMAILVPSDAVLHSKNADFVFIGNGPGLWKITEVQVGESIGDKVEILAGLQGGEKIIGTGAILLKPMLVQALLNEEAAKEMQPDGVSK